MSETQWECKNLSEILPKSEYWIAGRRHVYAAKELIEMLKGAKDCPVAWDGKDSFIPPKGARYQMCDKAGVVAGRVK